MLKGIFKTLFASAVVITFFTALAFADRGKTLYVPEDSVLPDGQVLKSGNYRVVVDEAAKEIQFWQNNQVVAKHTCKAVSLEKKTRTSEMRFAETAEKKRCLTEIRLAGKKEALVLDTEHGM